MRLMGEQFVTGETIDEALANARSREAQGLPPFVRHARRGGADRGRRARATCAPTSRRSTRSAARRPAAASTTGPGISIKLSALHPRYSRTQIDRVDGELYPVLQAPRVRSRGHDIGLNIDAEEADRLELSLDLLERLCFEPELAGWNGIGFVVQAYQKRCPFVIDCAGRSGAPHRAIG